MNTSKISEQFNKIAQDYDKQRRFFIPCFDDYYETCTNFLGHCKKDFLSILDLGAGTGLLTQYIYSYYPNSKLTLMDVSDQMLKVAKLRFKDLNNVQFIEGDYSKELPKDEFDLISSGLSIHHLDNEQKFKLYKNIYEKLPNGGYFINFDQFNSDSDFLNEQYNSWWYNLINTTEITKEEKDAWLKRRELDKETTIDEAKTSLKKAGFSQVDCIYHYMKFGVIIGIK